MAEARDHRRAALQALYQFDAGNDQSPEMVRQSLEHAEGSEQTQQKGFDLAVAAWQMREAADAAVAELTPDWPTYRQPMIDRSILRLAYYELITEHAPPKVVINEAVELAKEFSTEKSPLFLNGVLDKIYRTLRGKNADVLKAEEEPDGDAPAPDDRVENAPDTTAAGT